MILLVVDINNRYLSEIEEQVGKKINMNISFHSISFIVIVAQNTFFTVG